MQDKGWVKLGQYNGFVNILGDTGQMAQNRDCPR